MSKTIKTAVTNEKETKIAAIAAEAEAKPEATAEAKQSKAKVVKAEPKAEKKVEAKTEELGPDAEAVAEIKTANTIAINGDAVEDIKDKIFNAAIPNVAEAVTQTGMGKPVYSTVKVEYQMIPGSTEPDWKTTFEDSAKSFVKGAAIASGAVAATVLLLWGAEKLGIIPSSNEA